MLSAVIAALGLRPRKPILVFSSRARLTPAWRFRTARLESVCCSVGGGRIPEKIGDLVVLGFLHSVAVRHSYMDGYMSCALCDMCMSMSKLNEIAL